MAKAAVVLAALSALGSACAATGVAGSVETGGARVLYAGDQCFAAGREAGVRVLTSRDELSSLLKTLSRGLPEGPRPPEPAWDPDRERAVVLSMGTRPTAGYLLALGSADVEVAGDRALVRIRWEEPPPGSIQAQMLTSPCLVLAVTTAGHASLEFADQDGVGRFRAVAGRGR